MPCTEQVSETTLSNKCLLEFIKDNWEDLHKYTRLMPKYFGKLNTKEATNKFADFILYERSEIKAFYSKLELQTILLKNIKESSWQQHLVELADALVGYKFYLPAFLDFRGQNYRYGPLHFHEHDLVRSLILFADYDREGGVCHPYLDFSTKIDHNSNEFKIFTASTAFNHKKYENYYKAYIDFIERFLNLKFNDLGNEKYKKKVQLYEYISSSRNPFQFLVGIITNVDDDLGIMLKTPINQDASASVY